VDADIAVVGAGPAGLAAAVESARLGARIVVLDENDRPGGQLFKQIHKFFGSEEHKAGTRGIRIGYELLEEARSLSVDIRLNTVVYGLFDGLILGTMANGRTSTLTTQRVILATGASENVLAFPGWDLPGVMGAGAAQTLMNIHRVLPGRRVLMVGAGNVGLIVSYQLVQAGAEVVAVVEAAPTIGGYGVHAAKLRRAGVPVLTGHTVRRAEGADRVERVEIGAVDEQWQLLPGSERTLEVDTICLAVGLSPLAELAWMAGCRFDYQPALGGWVPIHNERMETNLPGVYIAGDLAGVEEASTAMEEGRLAGLAAAASLGRVTPEVAATRVRAARLRLAALRQGPFSALRATAKERLEQGGTQ
jgi:thioredoxin reductase